jgi:PAS domain S-box-containing protein
MEEQAATQKIKLRLLFVEDNRPDAELALKQLQKSGFEVTADIVQTAGDFRSKLASSPYDVILSDLALPNWSGLDALEILKQTSLDIPFIMVTGTVGEETVAECLKLGATDYVLKDRPTRLPAAIRRALQEKALREERKRAEAERMRLMTAIEQAAEGLVITDADATIQYVNPAFSAMTGYSREEVIGKNPRILKSGKQDAAFYVSLWATLLGGQVWRGEMINRRKDGSLYTEKMSITPVHDEHGKMTHIVAVKEDITARKLLEEQFRQAQKMEAVGRLAAGVAHDFNNLLTIIVGYSDVMLDQFGADNPLRGYTTEIKDAGERAAGLTRQLLTFSRQQVLALQIVDLNALITNLTKLLKRLIGEDIELVFNPGSRTATVKADPGLIEQVLMNLAVNSRDAMPSGGKVTIETSHVQMDEAFSTTHFSMPAGPYVMLAVSDTGCGMDKDTQNHIFEPFFTTKETGKGTGLGLATVYGIVKQSEGHIWVYSEPGVGTTFKVYLPAVMGAPAAVEESAASTGGSETVLLVEDDASVRGLAKMVLEARGGVQGL